MRAAKASAGAPARGVLAAVAALGVLAGAVGAAIGQWQVAPLIGWDVAAASFLLWWTTVYRLGPEDTKEHALQDDPGRGAVDLLLLLASLASLVAVASVVSRGADHHGGSAIALAAFSLASVFVSWALIHAIYTLRYARIYYGDVPGGIDFNSAEPPQYSDFAYLAFSVGMTFQVSDTSLQTKEFRSTVFRHALLAYFYGAVVIAATINLVVGLRA
jgi:uncharacterized membrane protein